jgi:hypothetical protein
MAHHRLVRLFLVYVVLDVICIGGGMGVPIFCILLGLLVGWRLVRVLELPKRPLAESLASLLRAAVLTSGVTFVLMAALWATAVPMLFDPAADIAHFGIPLLLFQPRASLIAWLVLMILVSPVLQLPMTMFGGHVALLREARRAARPPPNGRTVPGGPPSH